jgi:hypothetical protein
MIFKNNLRTLGVNSVDLFAKFRYNKVAPTEVGGKD